MGRQTAEEAQMLVEGVRQFARSELIERDRRWDATEESLAEVLPQLAEMGFMAIRLPESLGGLGCSMETYSAILHELAYASPSVSVSLSVHNMTGEVMKRFGREPVRSQILANWSRAEHLGSFAISEADAGSDPASLTTRAERHGDEYVVNGAKMWITNGLSGRWFMTLVRTGEGKGGVSAIWLDGSQAGVERLAIKGKTGIRGSETVALHLTDVRCPVSYLLGQEGDGLKIALAALDGGRIGIASQATGIMEACIDEMCGYAPQRIQFGHPIAEFQAIRDMIADSAVELEAARELRLCAARLADAGRPFTAAAAKAKLYATEAANRVAYRAVQVHGGSGYVNECRAERLARDARVTTLYEGTSEIQRIVIARELAKQLAG